MDQGESNPPIRIRDLQVLRTIAHPLRLQILESLMAQPQTVKQVAEQLGLAPGKLYYHVKLLENNGLIGVVETRVEGNIIEKVYRATSSSIEMDPALLSFATEEGQENIGTMEAATLDVTRDDLLRSLQARAYALAQGAPEKSRRVMSSRSLSRMDDNRAAEFRARLSALIEEFEAADVQGSDAESDLQSYALTVVMYPRFYYPDSEQVESS